MFQYSLLSIPSETALKIILLRNYTYKLEFLQKNHQMITQWDNSVIIKLFEVYLS